MAAAATCLGLLPLGGCCMSMYSRLVNLWRHMEEGTFSVKMSGLHIHACCVRWKASG